MTAIREPLPRWGYPDRPIIVGQEFPSGRPQFAPFPTITNLVNAALCPAAICHDTLHGIDNALTGQYPFQRRGDLFHKFIAYLKLSLRNRDIDLTGSDILTQQQRIRSLFLNFAANRGFFTNEVQDIWRLYVEPWVRRKLQDGELQSISPRDQYFFEISVAHRAVSFPLDTGVRHYPLRGRFDEIDLLHNRIIERTIRGSEEDQQVPLLKDYQVWLLWRILTTLRGEELPASWNRPRFRDFSLVVETPYRDFQIASENLSFDMDTHYAYAWINDICTSESPRIFREIDDNRQCSPESPHPECGHPFINCFPHSYPHPTCRPEIRREFQPWFRLLLWEQQWKGHLWCYQLFTLTRQELIEQGLILEGRVTSVSGNEIELEVIGRESSSLRGYESCTIVIYGTLHCGIRMDARLVGVRGNKFVMRVGDTGSVLPREILQEILVLPPEMALPPVMKEPLTFLDRQTQSSLYRLQYSGAINPEKARRRSLIQLLEAIFGIRPLHRG